MWTGLLAAAALLIAGCTPPGLPPPQSPSSRSSAPTTVPPAQQVVIGVDGVVSGFNPHVIADFSPAARAVAALVLPFTTVVRADGSTWFDPAIVDTAAVTSTDPYVVTYTLNKAAAWSDGTPVTAEDFTYLWEQMLVQPGSVDPAGYRLITAIRSRDAGKTVDVQFDGPFPDWPTLFSPLLPAHILKDAPGGWTDGLATGIPVSANKYKMSSYDTVTGQITLVANGKYWGDAPGPDTVVLRIGSPAELLAALRRGDLGALFARPDLADSSAIDLAVPVDRRTTVPLPATVQLVMNTAAGPTATPAVRRAIATALDLDALRTVLAGGRPDGMLAVNSQVKLPSTQTVGSGGDPPLAVTADPSAARAILAEAGYQVDGIYARTDPDADGDPDSGAGPDTGADPDTDSDSSGSILRLTLGVPSQDQRMQAAARSIQSTLGRAGILVDIVVDAIGPLVTQRTAQGQLDLSLLTVPRSRSDPVAAGSAFGCPTATSAETQVRTGNLSGFCSVEVQQELDAALAGRGGLGAVDGQIWADLPVLPIGQPTAMFVVGPALAGVLDGAGAGWLWSGPLQSVPGWS